MLSKGKKCKNCSTSRRQTYLHYEMLPAGMRCVFEEDGKMVYHTFCPTCKIYSTEIKR